MPARREAPVGMVEAFDADAAFGDRQRQPFDALMRGTDRQRGRLCQMRGQPPFIVDACDVAAPGRLTVLRAPTAGGRERGLDRPPVSRAARLRDDLVRGHTATRLQCRLRKARGARYRWRWR